MLAWDSQCDAAMVKAIGAGDERTFIELVTRFHASMVGFARGFVHTEAAAEDVVQDTWEAVVKCIDRFEGRSTLKTWIFLILANQSRSRAARDGRSISFSDPKWAPLRSDPRFRRLAGLASE